MTTVSRSLPKPQLKNLKWGKPPTTKPPNGSNKPPVPPPFSKPKGTLGVDYNNDGRIDSFHFPPVDVGHPLSIYLYQGTRVDTDGDGITDMTYKSRVPLSIDTTGDGIVDFKLCPMLVDSDPKKRGTGK